MDRFLTLPVCELCRKASGRTRFAARRGRGMKDHGRAQETVVIGKASARHRPLSAFVVGRGAATRLLRLGAGLIGADSCQAFVAALRLHNLDC